MNGANWYVKSKARRQTYTSAITCTGDILELGEIDKDELADGEFEALGDKDALGERLELGLREGELDADGLMLELGLREEEGEILALGLVEADGDWLAEAEDEGETLTPPGPG